MPECRAWENDKASPSIKRIPSILRFLTYCPYDPKLELGDRLVLSRSVNGITQRQLAHLMEIDQRLLPDGNAETDFLIQFSSQEYLPAGHSSVNWV